MTWKKSLLRAVETDPNPDAMTPHQREVSEQQRMDELWSRLAKASEEIRAIIAIKESLKAK